MDVLLPSPTRPRAPEGQAPIFLFRTAPVRGRRAPAKCVPTWNL